MESSPSRSSPPQSGTRVCRALLSVSDKEGLVEFARGLAALGIEILSTGGTYKALVQAGVLVREVSDYTGFPELMHGRVKTLHPKVHGGILALRDDASHVAAMQAHAIAPIDLVVVNLYPFEATVAQPGVSLAEAIEQIDIGGPSMLRSAAKNHRFVTVVTDPADYRRVLEQLALPARAVSDELRAELATKAFQSTARYDAAIARWLWRANHAGLAPADLYPPTMLLAGRLEAHLRYGENPHQSAAFYREASSGEPGVLDAELLGGKTLSYNNLIDLDAALGLAKEFDEPFVAVTKHNNPCGAASAPTLVQALEAAWAGDPVSAFGSVLACTRELDLACAEFLVAGNRFVEAIIAPGFDARALEVLTGKPKWGKSVRLLATGPIGPAQRLESELEIKKVIGGFLAQQRDLQREDPRAWRCVTKAAASPAQIAALAFANKVSKHVKSNAIVLATGTRVLGVGAGQMSRVDAVRLAVHKAGASSSGAVLASDAFFPFPDGVEHAIEAGVSAILQPGGSVRDEEVIAACDRRSIPMLFSGVRHFRH